MRFFFRVIIATFSLILVAKLLPGIDISGLYPALISAILLGILNALVRPILIFLTLPITVVTLGIFIFVINAGIFLFVASFVDGFAVDGFFSALLGSVLVSMVSSIAYRFI